MPIVKYKDPKTWKNDSPKGEADISPVVDFPRRV